MNVHALARPEILAMRPYASARGTAAADGVLLNANEAPAALSDDPAWAEMALHRYPAPQPDDLVRRLAAVYQVAPERVLVTRGSDEGIDLLTRVFCRPGQDAIVECPPCFGMYRVAAAIQGAEVIAVPRDDGLRLDVAQLERTIAGTDGPDIKLVFLTSPNNPTGDLLPRRELLRLLAACGDRALLVLDEAYIEFCDAASATDLLDDYPQLVILRTLSKAWGAAGLRCGALLADPAIIELLGRVMAPYPLTAPAIAAALAVTGPGGRARQSRMLAAIAAQKDRLVSTLAGRDWVERTWPGEANFVLARVDDGPGLVAHCASSGVRIRDFSTTPGLANCVRISIGTSEDMQALATALDGWPQARDGSGNETRATS
ncbi:histidinol-phosphate transaminase [Marinihelvus fidelis]|uniref:Histidinol-phosphate aminotransferase n=1 Tax=Marinihelvus fidelis TaxID=2613842 RepID=A0A5N0T8M5_9GAMM|nr:histidinol-phosphate transaminase [Marinihelvus fidelis]KAA9131383.1 histidinol-phosphate transaminase [Marinihelvus fidelis]